MNKKIADMVMDSHTVIINGETYLPYDCGEDGFNCTDYYDDQEYFIEYTEIDLKRDRFYKLVLIDENDY